MSEANGNSRLNRQFARLNRLGPVRSIRSWYKHKPPGDQRAIKVLVVFFAAVGAYFLIWQPTQTALAQAESYYENRHQQYQWVKRHETEIRALLGQRGDSNQQALGGRSLLSIVTDSAKKQSIQLKRFEPKGDNAVNIWLEGADFNKLVVWLDDLRDQFQVRVDQVSIDRDEQQPGLVGVKLQLSV